MPLYDNGKMNKMRQDAIRRSQEMHRRSMVNSSHYSQGQQKRTDLPPAPSPVHEQKEKVDMPQSIQRQTDKKGKLTEALDKLLEGKIDSDKLMIIALMVILAKEGADMKLILALGYILI